MPVLTYQFSGFDPRNVKHITEYVFEHHVASKSVLLAHTHEGWRMVRLEKSGDGYVFHSLGSEEYFPIEAVDVALLADTGKECFVG